ncbi:MAG: uncharacterized protein KVP18_003497 [Porospora cf. gigantea A]|uniref:uncharacterized protein n=1 Tax=Porospora cf. gigantea A TaxID=2853593 RepID=UPI00355ACD43|nr:MAG: hypothetical protein KVP18_003497 [Porospora cf. gigantea A]
MDEQQLRERQARRAARILRAESERLGTLQQDLGNDAQEVRSEATPVAVPPSPPSRTKAALALRAAQPLLKNRRGLAMGLGCLAGVARRTELVGMQAFLAVQVGLSLLELCADTQPTLAALIVTSCFCVALPWTAVVTLLLVWVALARSYAGRQVAEVAPFALTIAYKSYSVVSMAWSDFCAMFSVYQCVRFLIQNSVT